MIQVIRFEKRGRGCSPFFCTFSCFVSEPASFDCLVSFNSKNGVVLVEACDNSLIKVEV